MDDIELVIKIPKEVYNHILKAKSVPDMLGIDIVNIINAVKTGTPLPEGHGRIADMDEAIDCIKDAEGDEIEGGKIMKYRRKPTVIDALKIGENDDEIRKFANSDEITISNSKGKARVTLHTETPDCDMFTSGYLGDYIVKYNDGQLDIYDGKTFEDKYEPVD